MSISLKDGRSVYNREAEAQAAHRLKKEQGKLRVSSQSTLQPPAVSSLSKKMKNREGGSEGESGMAEPTRTNVSNINQFLKYTTPKVQLQQLPKTCMWDKALQRCRPADTECVNYFTLGDLWDSFDECSAYGAGVPLVLNGEDTVVQYYVPYLSALQLYTHSGSRFNFRKYGDESDASDGDFRSDTSSEASSDNESDGAVDHGRDHHNNHHGRTIWESICGCNTQINSRLSGLSLSGIDPCEDNREEKRGQLLLQYFEESAPYSRVPLLDKISDLARTWPELRTIRSFELMPTSWMSIAWYPIYRIPTGPTLRDLATCFLTFHSLSTPLGEDGFGPTSPTFHQSGSMGQAASQVVFEQNMKKIALHPFGLASYKLRGAFWTSAGTTEKQLASELQGSADSWLKALCVRHPDFEFFMSRSPSRK